MKTIFLCLSLGLCLSAHVQAQYNYSVGNLQVGNITYKCEKGGICWIITNVNNSLSNAAPTHPVIDCGEAHLKKTEWTKIENVFKQVFPPQRRALFGNRENIYLNFFADATGNIKEVAFDFAPSCPVTPQELYNLEVGLKALAPLQYSFPADCTGVNYRIGGSPIYIHKL